MRLVAPGGDLEHGHLVRGFPATGWQRAHVRNKAVWQDHFTTYPSGSNSSPKTLWPGKHRNSRLPGGRAAIIHRPPCRCAASSVGDNVAHARDDHNEMGFQGYRANVVTYAIARLSNEETVNSSAV
jgi:hypothetical protein